MESGIRERSQSCEYEKKKKSKLYVFLKIQTHTSDSEERGNKILGRFFRGSPISHYQIKVSMYLRMDE